MPFANDRFVRCNWTGASRIVSKRPGLLLMFYLNSSLLRTEKKKTNRKEMRINRSTMWIGSYSYILIALFLDFRLHAFQMHLQMQKPFCQISSPHFLFLLVGFAFFGYSCNLYRIFGHRNGTIAIIWTFCWSIIWQQANPFSITMTERKQFHAAHLFCCAQRYCARVRVSPFVSWPMRHTGARYIHMLHPSIFASVASVDWKGKRLHMSIKC